MGYAARNVAQEHSFVPTLWQRKGMPDLLVFLEVSYDNTLKRSTLRWIESDYERQLERLKHARENADLIIDTNILSQDEVLKVILDAIQKLEKS
jgi:deoxyadenosine/deoxycytidine kinase